jgi:cytochrome c-type biogenesis protein CcmH/NrfG
MKKVREAIEIFKLNVETYPASANVYDSLGEAYMLNGNKELAVKNYQRSVELSPQNTNAAEILKKLRAP